MTRKEGRQAAIVELVSAHEVGSQEELRQLLVERGVDVTQATLSREVTLLIHRPQMAVLEASFL